MSNSTLDSESATTSSLSMLETELAEDPRIKFNHETSKIGWHELQKFYAKGMVICVAEGLDLIDVAVGFFKDDKAAVQAWLAGGSVKRADDTQALQWHKTDATVWAVVVAPWVLVQPVSEPS